MEAYDKIIEIFSKSVHESIEELDKEQTWTSVDDSLKQYYLEFNYLY